VHGQDELADVVAAGGAPGAFLGLDQRRQQQGRQHGNDRDHHQHLDQSERSPASRHGPNGATQPFTE
jgi:hypothetical protein